MTTKIATPPCMLIRKPSIVFECVDVQQTYEEMVARDVVFTQLPKAMGSFAIFRDPEGNEYGLRR